MVNVKLDAKNIEFKGTEKVTWMKCISRMKYSEYNINHLKRNLKKNQKLAYDASNIIPVKEGNLHEFQIKSSVLA